MKYLPDNLMMLMLAVVLGISPIQNIAASVSDCVSKADSMHHQMTMSGNIMQHDVSKANSEDDCCHQNTCDMSDCVNTFTAVVSSNKLNDMGYTVSNIQLKPGLSLIQFYPSSLYRPPKI